MPWLHINPIDEHVWSRSQFCVEGWAGWRALSYLFKHSTWRSKNPSRHLSPFHSCSAFFFSTLFLPLHRLYAARLFQHASYRHRLNSGWQLSNVWCTSSETHIDYLGLQAAMPCRGMHHSAWDSNSAAPSGLKATCVGGFLSVSVPLWSYFKVALACLQSHGLFFLHALQLISCHMRNHTPKFLHSLSSVAAENVTAVQSHPFNREANLFIVFYL